MDAVRQALADSMREDARVFLMGIDVAAGGGVFGVTRGLADEFGTDRVRDTPISETAVLGAAVGAAMTGTRPVVELMFMDFLGVCMDPVLNQAAKLRYMTGGGTRVPLVLRTQTGSGRSAGAQHSQSLEGLLAHIPGLWVYMPATVSDAYWLLRQAIASEDPVVYVENRRLYGLRGRIEADAPPPGARVMRAGRRCTIVTWGRMVQESLTATDGMDVEVVDLRTLAPLDITTLAASVRKTSRALVVTEAVEAFGPGAELAARIAADCFHDLDAPVRRLGAAAAPIPYSPELERRVVPDAEAIRSEVEALLRH